MFKLSKESFHTTAIDASWIDVIARVGRESPQPDHENHIPLFLVDPMSVLQRHVYPYNIVIQLSHVHIVNGHVIRIRVHTNTYPHTTHNSYLTVIGVHG